MANHEDEYDIEAGMANLTDEEREALAADEEAAEAEQQDENEQEQQQDVQAQAEEQKPVESAAEAEQTDKHEEEQAENKEQEQPQGQDIYIYKAEVGDIDSSLKNIEKLEAEVTKQFEDGDIDLAQYVKRMNEFGMQRAEILTQRMKAEIAAEMAQQVAIKQWQAQVAQFLREIKAKENIDYGANDAMFSDLDSVVRALANNPANADKPGRWFLEQAHKAVKAMHGIQDAAQESKQAADQMASRKPPLEAVPKSIANIPGSGVPGDVADEFADIDNLSGEEYEMALARLSPEQRERYLSRI